MKKILNFVFILLFVATSVLAVNYYDSDRYSGFSQQAYQPYGSYGGYGGSRGYDDFIGPYFEDYRSNKYSDDSFNYDRYGFDNSYDYNGNRNYGNLNGFYNSNDLFERRNYDAFESGRISKDSPCVTDFVKIDSKGKKNDVKITRQLCDGITYDFERRNSLNDRYGVDTRNGNFGLNLDSYNANENIRNSANGLNIGQRESQTSNEAERFYTSFGRGSRITF